MRCWRVGVTSGVARGCRPGILDTNYACLRGARRVLYRREAGTSENQVHYVTTTQRGSFVCCLRRRSTRTVE